MKIRRHYLRCAIATLLLSALSSLCLAQSATPQLSRVTITHVKPDMLTEWLDLQKNEVVPALKKAGQTTRTVYHTSLFGNSYEYVVITPFQKFAEFDAGSPLIKALGETAAARLGAKLQKCTESSTSFASTRLADLSNVLDGPPPQMIVSARYRIAPGKTADFQSLVKSDILPVYKKARVGLTVNQRSVGTNPNDVTMSTAYSKFADLDGGPFLVKQLGQDAVNKLNAKFIGIRTLIEVVVRTRVAELSF
jgi:hypothetical protein